MHTQNTLVAWKGKRQLDTEEYGEGRILTTLAAVVYRIRKARNSSLWDKSIPPPWRIMEQLSWAGNKEEHTGNGYRHI